MDLTPGPEIPRELFNRAADALVATRGPGSRYDPEDYQIADAIEADDWCLECVGRDAAATVAVKMVAAILWPAAYRAGREDAARDIRAEVADGERPASIERKPAQCKTCSAPCLCTCHQGDQPRTPEPDVTQTPTAGGEEVGRG